MRVYTCSQSWTPSHLPPHTIPLGHPSHLEFNCEMLYPNIPLSIHFSSVAQLCLLVIPWTVARQAFLSTTNSQSLLKLKSIKLVMPSNHLILCPPFLVLPSIFPSIRIFSNESHQVTTYWSFSFSISPSNEYSGLISFRIAGLISLQSKGLSRVFSSTTVQKHQFFSPNSQLFSKHCLWWCEL